MKYNIPFQKMFYLKNCYVDNIDNQEAIVLIDNMAKKADSDSYANLEEIKSMTYWNSSLWGISFNKYLWKDIQSTLSEVGQLSQTYSQNPGIAVDHNDWLLFTQQSYLGKRETPAGANDDDWKNLNNATDGYRQILSWTERPMVLIGNGTNLAGYTGDGSDFDAELKSLDGKSFRCMDANGYYCAIGCGSRVNIWDSTSDGWNNIIFFSETIKSIKRYKDGFIGVGSYSVWYFTPFGKPQKLSFFPFNEISCYDNGVNVLPDGVRIDEAGDRIFIQGGTSTYGLMNRGLWIYDIKRDNWTFQQYYGWKWNTESPGAISRYGNALYSGYEIDSKYYTARTSLDKDGTITNSEFITPLIDFKDKFLLKNVKLFYKLHPSQVNKYSSISFNVKLKTATLLEQPFSRGYTNNNGAADGSTIKVDGSKTSYNYASVGDEVTSLVVRAGESSNIASIANEGTDTETWTMTDDYEVQITSGDYLRIAPFRKVSENDSQTITDYSQNSFYWQVNQVIDSSCLLKFTASSSNYPAIITGLQIEVEPLTNL